MVSNKGRELNAHRIHTFKLAEFVDAFVSTCLVQLRKPDEEIFRLALDLAQSPAVEIVYMEDTALFVQVAAGLDIRGIEHDDCRSTRAELSAHGLDCAGKAQGSRCFRRPSQGHKGGMRRSRLKKTTAPGTP